MDAADASGTQVPAETYDLRGLNCPLPVLKTRRRIAGLPAGARLWVETTDPLAVIDIPAFCHDDGHRLVTSESMAGGHRFLIERGGTTAGRIVPKSP
ncbi:response regulator SirA [Aquibium carbonis]|uniref:Response regulator SirA n=1 Tax=Aquibium carbonis TaxID=2495581 RepID=A0A429YZA3_9HYPH|nr:sulfurtransferase TusA family protein [Aquibium carbonis]RST86734.1 response regulator SirA [Aquibium carbonis]